MTFGGVFKSTEITSREIETALENEIMIDGSNIAGCSNVNDADAFLSPDLNSFRRLPFFDSECGNVAMFMCGILTREKKPFEGCSRSLLEKELNIMKSLGFSKMNVGFEPEFFILKNKPKSCLDIAYLDNGKYHANENEDAGAEIRRKIIYELERIGVKCLTSHHECAPSQYEITYRFSNAIESCDNLILIKFLIKEIAKNYGYTATFMPKIDSREAGNGLHTNVSLERDNTNVFAGENFELSETGKLFITGVLTYAKEICLLTNPTINSYKRLVSGFEAPVNICWSKSNRSAMIRVPHCHGKASRIEIRNVDSTSNPYLVAMIILASGLEGIIKNMSISLPVDGNIFLLGDKEKRDMRLDSLPNCLGDSIKEFENSELMKNCFGTYITNLFIKSKNEEVFRYNSLVNSFDFENYF